MRYKTLGNTGLAVSEICLGTMTFGGKGFWTAIGQLDQSVADTIEEVLRSHSADLGVTTEDLAAWRPPAPTRGRRTAAKSTKESDPA